jgi:hypothetical protein
MILNLELLINSYTPVRNHLDTTFLTKKVELQAIPRIDEIIALEEAYFNVEGVVHILNASPIIILSLFIEDREELVLEPIELDNALASLQDAGWVIMSDDEKPTLPISKLH